MPRKTTEAAATTKSPAKKTVTRRTKKTAEEPIVLTWEHVATRAYYMHLEAGGIPSRTGFAQSASSSSRR
jgi:hypothetical protein